MLPADRLHFGQRRAFETCGNHDRSDADQAANRGGVMGDRSTAVLRLAVDQVGEETSVVGLSIGVRMPGRVSGHEVDVSIEKMRLMVGSCRPAQRPHQQPGTVRVEGILAGLHAVMVVPVRLPPELRLAL